MKIKMHNAKPDIGANKSTCISFAACAARISQKKNTEITHGETIE
jgi:hypothetical protein